MLLAIKNRIIGSVVDRAYDSEHGVTGLLHPPGAGALPPGVADELVDGSIHDFLQPATDNLVMGRARVSRNDSKDSLKKFGTSRIN